MLQLRRLRDTSPRITPTPLLSLALLGGDHVDITRHKRHLLAPALGARRLNGFMLGDGLSALKLLSAFLATILVSRHKLKSSNESGRRGQNFTADG
jgi:hypothetical protein